MAIWQIFSAEGIAQPEQFDDTLAYMPGEEGFSNEEVAKEAKRRGKGMTFSMVSVPGWHDRVAAEEAAGNAAALAAQEAADEVSRQVAEEQAKQEAARQEAARKQEAQAVIANLLDPTSTKRAELEAQRDALLKDALPAQVKPLKALYQDLIAAL